MIGTKQVDTKGKYFMTPIEIHSDSRVSHEEIGVPVLIKKKRAAEMLDCSTRTVDRYEALGLLKGHRRNCRSTRFRLDDVLRFLKT